MSQSNPPRPQEGASNPLLPTSGEQTENLSNTTIKLSIFKDNTRRELESILSNIEGPKAVVLDSKVSGPLGLVADVKVLKEKGVEKIFYLDPNRLPCELNNIVYLIQPRAENMKYIANHINDHKRGKQRKNYTLIFIPRTTMICERMLEELGVFHDVNIHHLQMDLLVFDDDVLSLEIENSYRECFLQVLDMILRMRNEMEQEESIVVPEIDSLILIDRQVDMITPVMTQLTYEGRIDELFSIKFGQVLLDPEILGKDKAEKKQKYQLSSNDRLFSDIRNLNITRVGPFLNQRARELDAFKNKLKDQKTLGEIRDYAQYLPIYQKDFASLCVNLKILDQILLVVNDTEFREQLDAEQGLVGDDVDAFEYIEELINRQEPIHRVLRLFILQSLVTNGIKPKAFEFLKHEILQTYGNEYLFTLNNLEKLGLLIKQEVKPNFPLVRKYLRLISDVPIERNATDVSYVFSGYAPISARLIELTSKPNGWRSIDDCLKLLPGATHEATQEIPPGVKQLSEDVVQERNKITLVYFIGGITFAEIAAIRLLHKKEEGKRDFIIATTKLLNGNSLLDTLIEPVGNCVS